MGLGAEGHTDGAQQCVREKWLCLLLQTVSHRRADSADVSPCLPSLLGVCTSATSSCPPSHLGVSVSTWLPVPDLGMLKVTYIADWSPQLHRLRPVSLCGLQK